MAENSSKSNLFWIVLLVAVVSIPIGIAILYGLGSHSGIEFSPDDFSRRKFAYNQTPIINVTIKKKTYSDMTTPLEEHLVLDGFIKPVINRTKTWHLIQDSGTNSRFAAAECDARFLTDFLDLRNDDGDDYWTVWTADYPNSAKVFWPRIAELARDEMYLKVPDVMRLAMEIEKDDVVEFAKSLDDLIASSYLELGELDLQLNRSERARDRLKNSIRLRPSKRADQLLAKANQQLASRPSTVERIPKAIAPTPTAGHEQPKPVEPKGDQ